MRNIKYISLVLILFSYSVSLAQSLVKPVEWRTNVKMISEKEGEVVVIANIADGWHLYGFNQPANGPKSTFFDLSKSRGVKFISEITPSKSPINYHDQMFDMDLTCWKDKVVFRRKFKVVNSKDAEIKGYVSYMCCNNVNCMPPQKEEINKKIIIKK